MIPSKNQKRCKPLCADDRGVRLPRHVGTWAVVQEWPMLDPHDDPTTLFELRHERYEKASHVLVTRSTRNIVCAMMRADWQDKMREKGWKFR